MHSLRPLLHTLLLALLAAGLCILLNTPLPWMMAILIPAGFGFTLSALSGIHPATPILATSPGGIAEMSLTAKNLQLGVLIVTAFHVMRMAALVLTIGPLFRLAKRIRQEHGVKRDKREKAGQK